MPECDTLIIGAGPAGMFFADELLKGGKRNIIIVEKGKEIVSRECPQTKECRCPTCDILCGIGGAGGLSDGKNTISVTRGTQGEQLFPPEAEAIMRHVDQEVARYAGTEGVQTNELSVDKGSSFSRLGFRFSSYPLRHIGSDGIRRWAAAMRDSLKERGVEFACGIEARTIFTNSSGHATGVFVERHGVIRAKRIVIASGLDGSPWLSQQLRALNCHFRPGPAGFAIRLETSSEVLAPLFDTFYDFKMERGRLRSFCCNNHGYIVNENHSSLGVRNVNGHSYLSPQLRSDSSNFAIMSKISLSDTCTNPQDTVVQTARSVNSAAEGHSVVQRVEDFLCGRPSRLRDVTQNPWVTNPQARGEVDINSCLDGIPDLARDFRDYIVTLDRLVPGVVGEPSVVYAPEVKYYSPRLEIDAGWQSRDIPRLYVIGNASGYLDSLVAAATSGIIAARAINSEA